MDHPLPLFLCFSALLLLSLISSAEAEAINSNTTLVYNHCSNQTFTPQTKSPQIQQTLSSLFQQLVLHSSESKFFKHIESTGEDDDETGISGLFQCREDLSNKDCHNCVTNLPNLSNTLCKDSVTARVQLHGCYMHYELDGVNSESSGPKLMHKTCGEIIQNVGFEEMRDEAFAAVEIGVVELEGGGFCKTSYEAVQVMAQCVGGLGRCECGECVSSAVQIAEKECGGAVSGQIYLEECFLSYTYHQNGHIPKKQGEKNGTSGKSVAIVLGGAAALGFGLIFLLFVKSWSKKEDD